MTKYSIALKNLPGILKDDIDAVDVYLWNRIFIEYMNLSVESGKMVSVEEEADGTPSLSLTDLLQEDKEMMQASIVACEKVLNKFPILMIDPALESLIEDTVPDLKTLKLPYPGFFIDKKFPFKGGYLMGIYVLDMRSFIYTNLIEMGISKAQVDRVIGKMSEMGRWRDDDHMFFLSMFIDETEVTVVLSDILESTELIKTLPKKIGALSQRAMFYAANICNLIATHVNLDNPLDARRDVRVIPFYGNIHRKSRPTGFSTIRVFGNMKKYAQAYRRERRKYTQSTESVIVRGHWRHLSHERYKNKRGETIWIPPFIRGMDKELHDRIIKVKL